jgi:2-polyprenyl-3-methyl-5-hydroxy-6-metoxy-1,4-benzoquinol methylase
MSASTNHRQEVSGGERFEFGKNWQDFLGRLTPERIAHAEQSLRTMLEVTDLEGISMLDIGSGSGLFSLAARRLGARVFSFDYDPYSVACTRLLRERFFGDDENWTVAEGSVLDVDYLQSLGKFDLVYSWGVLHHTGAMWQALENATLPLADGGRLFIAIYSTRPFWTPWDKLLKRTYVRSPRPIKGLIAGGFIAKQIAQGAVKDVCLLRNPWARYGQSLQRGMSHWHDWFDWMGGYPFETATVDEIFQFYHQRGFTLEALRSTSRLGCNQFVLRKVADSWKWTKHRDTLGARLASEVA